MTSSAPATLAPSPIAGGRQDTVGAPVTGAPGRLGHWLGRARRTASVVSNVVTWLAVAAVVLVAVLLVVVPRLTGGTSLTVLTASMTPTIPAGSIVVTRPIDPADIEVGDVITFQRSPDSPALVTHRVVELQPDTNPPSFITKGDANDAVDTDPVAEGAVRGEVLFHVPYLGYVKNWLASPRGLLLLVFVPMLLLIGDSDASAAAPARRRRWRRRHAGSAAARADAAAAGVPGGTPVRLLALTLRLGGDGDGQAEAVADAVGGRVVARHGDICWLAVVGDDAELEAAEQHLARSPHELLDRSTSTPTPIAPAGSGSALATGTVS